MQRATQRTGGNSSLSLCKGHCETMAKGDYHSEIQRKLIETFGKTYSMSCQDIWWFVEVFIFLAFERNGGLNSFLNRAEEHNMLEENIQNRATWSVRESDNEHTSSWPGSSMVCSIWNPIPKNPTGKSPAGAVCSVMVNSQKASIRDQSTSATKGQKVSIPGFASHRAHNHSWGSHHAQRHA